MKKSIKGLFNSDANVEACKEEILDILKKDRILRKHYKALLNRAQKAVSSGHKSIAEKTRILKHVEYIIHELDSRYMAFALDDLKESIANKDIDGMEFCANVVVSQAVYNGWSAKALLELLRFFKSNETFDEQWDKFSAVLLGVEKTRYDVLLNIPFKQQKAEEQTQTVSAFERIGLQIKTYEDLLMQFSDISWMDISLP